MKLDWDIVEGLLTILDSCNELVKCFQMVRDRVKQDSLIPIKLVIKAARSGDGRHQNMPTAGEIAGLIVGNIEDTIGIRDIIVDDCKLGLTRISDLHSSFMAMQYPLLFPYGEDGFRLGVELNQNTNNAQKKGKKLHTWRKLLQTYIMDLMTCIEEERLHWVKVNQSKIRAELYCGIKDALHRGDTEGAQVGKRIVLPSSFTGGPRYMTQNYQDAIALCRVMGNPDLFITVTSNPKWNKILEFLRNNGGQRPNERPDIVARVFKIKLDSLMEDLQKNNHFGKCIVAVYTIEFQKRGLPHAHILIWLHPAHRYPTPAKIDEIIVAEIPDKTKDPVGYDVVSKYMTHGLCGQVAPRSPCMKNLKCTKHFPKKYINQTCIDDAGFPIYRRRCDENVWVEKGGIKLDNSYVVPYNRNLIVKYQAHINVEWCNRGRSIKYLFKYITKGPDYVSASLQHISNNAASSSNAKERLDEVQYYLDCRYISAPESIWRIYGFDIYY
ncbi:uncharacterized protein LOC109847833 [Asparagus officinalis]|uniref:uncharacterized protein LOC109847833 n=1 Tax=Asparagus officinalis TaxID=4686 RepID=UPI00098E8580|nr:uncharacterized protein LOC109847833 [Asparagus officinalis]